MGNRHPKPVGEVDGHPGCPAIPLRHASCWWVPSAAFAPESKGGHPHESSRRYARWWFEGRSRPRWSAPGGWLRCARRIAPLGRSLRRVGSGRRLLPGPLRVPRSRRPWLPPLRSPGLPRRRHPGRPPTAPAWWGGGARRYPPPAAVFFKGSPHHASAFTRFFGWLAGGGGVTPGNRRARQLFGTEVSMNDHLT